MIGCKHPLFMASLAVLGPNCPILAVGLQTFVMGQAKSHRWAANKN